MSRLPLLPDEPTDPALKAMFDEVRARMLTAHPTEVQRKSILDAERAIAELVEQRDRKSTRLNSSHVLRSRMPSSA